MTIDYPAKAHAITTKYLDRIEDHRNDRMLSSSGRAHRVSWEYDAAKKRVDRYREKYETQRAKTHSRLARELFGLSEAANSSTVIAHRDAMDRARTLIPKSGEVTHYEASVREAQSMLRTAEMSGDKQLAKAIFAVAHEQGWDEVTHAYAETRPGTAEKLAEFDATAPAQDVFDDWDNLNAFHLIEPPEYLTENQRTEAEMPVRPFLGLEELDASRADAVGSFHR